MKGRTLNIVLFVLLIAVSGLTWSLKREPTTSNYLVLPEMYYSVPYNPQSENPNFVDDATMQPPVEGTIARGFMPLHYKATPEDAKRAGEELHNPFSPDSVRELERGTELFRSYCQPCHGTAGLGDGIIPKYGFPPPPSFASPPLVAMKDGQIFHTVTFGKGNMPSLRSQVPRADRWRIILRVRQLQTLALRKGAPAASP